MALGQILFVFVFFSFLFFNVGLELRGIYIIYRYFKLSRNPSQPFLLMIFYTYNKHIPAAVASSPTLFTWLIFVPS